MRRVTTLGSKALCRAAAALLLSAACSDSNAPSGAQLRLVSTKPRVAAANTELVEPIVISVTDAHGRGIANQRVAFSVVDGEGSLSLDAATFDVNGNVTAPRWRLGKYALPQQMRASLSGVELDIEAAVETKFRIDVRFVTSLPENEQTVFKRAAARIMAAVTGDVPNVPASNFARAHATAARTSTNPSMTSSSGSRSTPLMASERLLAGHDHVGFAAVATSL